MMIYIHSCTLEHTYMHMSYIHAYTHAYIHVQIVHVQCSNVPPSHMGGDLGGTRGDGPPQKCEVGERPMHPSPNILRSSVVGCARKYEQSQKRCHKGILF